MPENPHHTKPQGLQRQKLKPLPPLLRITETGAGAIATAVGAGAGTGAGAFAGGALAGAWAGARTSAGTSSTAAAAVVAVPVSFCFCHHVDAVMPIAFVPCVLVLAFRLTGAPSSMFWTHACKRCCC